MNSNSKYYQQEIETMSREDMTALQNEKLIKQVRRVYDNVPYYRSKMDAAGVTPDAVLTELEAAMEALGELTGRTVREDITQRIFERFCVGK